MKTLKLSIVLLLLLGSFSCKKDNSASASLTSDQAADMASSALASNSGGVASMTDNISANALTVTSVGGKTIDAVNAPPKWSCGSTLSDSATFAGTTSAVTFNYFAKYSRTMNCVSEVPDNIANTLAYNGTFSGPRISTTATGTANATIAGLEPADTAFTITGQYARTGTFASKIGNQATGNSNLTIVITSITLSKTTRTITSGSGTFSITGVAGKVNYSYAGTITFNGDGTATLAVTGGSSYVITLATGVYVKH